MISIKQVNLAKKTVIVRVDLNVPIVHGKITDTERIERILPTINYLISQKIPNSFNKTINYFKKFNNCVLIFIRDSNLKSVSQTLKKHKNNENNKMGQDKLIKTYGIGAQIIKSLGIKNMILVTRSRKKVVGLDGYGIKIVKQEILK